MPSDFWYFVWKLFISPLEDLPFVYSILKFHNAMPCCRSVFIYGGRFSVGHFGVEIHVFLCWEMFLRYLSDISYLCFLSLFSGALIQKLDCSIFFFFFFGLLSCIIHFFVPPTLHTLLPGRFYQLLAHFILNFLFC